MLQTNRQTDSTLYKNKVGFGEPRVIGTLLEIDNVPRFANRIPIRHTNRGLTLKNLLQKKQALNSALIIPQYSFKKQKRFPITILIIPVVGYLIFKVDGPYKSKKKVRKQLTYSSKLIDRILEINIESRYLKATLLIVSDKGILITL